MLFVLVQEIFVLTWLLYSSSRPRKKYVHISSAYTMSINLPETRIKFPKAWKQFFKVKTLKFFDADTGSGTEKIRIRDKHPGLATLCKNMAKVVSSQEDDHEGR
jgi:hypothetical protein